MPSVLGRPEGDLFAQYRCQVRHLRAAGLAYGIDDNEIQLMMQAQAIKYRPRPSLTLLQASMRKIRRPTSKLPIFASIVSFIIVSAVFMSSIISYGMLTYHKQSYNVVARNVQDFIHPMMQVLRYVTVPMIRTFPGITALYDESCLLANPFSNYRKTDCWPCTGVYSPVIITKPVENPHVWQPYSVYPFLMKGISPEVTFSSLQAIYWKEQIILDQFASKISSTVSNWTKINDVMRHDLEENPTQDRTAHITWRINQLDATRPMRQLFKRPKFIPPWVNMERFVFIDEHNSTGYDMVRPKFDAVLPITESFSVFLMQTCGERRIVLQPINSCQGKCPKISVHMKPSYLLYFSNLYYTVKSYPVESSGHISLVYMGAH